MKNILFLDIDGVLNCQVFYDRVGFKGEERENNICTHRVEWLNELCKDIDMSVVLSSSWRFDEDVIDRLKLAGATFEVIGITPLLGKGSVRGNEIHYWLEQNIPLLFPNTFGSNFKNYVILDDDSDMLLRQREHFFHCDSYSGLTPNICYKIKRFLSFLK